jgi:hypothetical protein
MADVTDFKFGYVGIVDLGVTISEKLAEYGVMDGTTLTINLNEEEFKKVDEDLFYRNRKSEDDEFIPSEGEIDIKYDGVRIIIKNKTE